MSNSVPSIGETSRTPVTLASTRSASRGEVLLLTRSSGIHLPDVAEPGKTRETFAHNAEARSWSRVPESALGPRARTYDLITVATLGRAHTPVDLPHVETDKRTRVIRSDGEFWDRNYAAADQDQWY